ncbi:shikimate dehydrogenase [Inmirania thermothiophila]|uniref:Shikimate dehydrogenase (NADP(+)) n=1 Tax=Inmirania thermothiophila TaxID=1750597 RepID=A0A3N1Y6B7_9GAMM|nr:shikimate dehydrogenase [Inmirania thermothiophila]ROR34366.1 shikimate dehydrogenase [Inmirania thermothiophila]
MSDRYAVFGNPVRHSLSPRIHALFAAATGQDLTYEAVEAPVGGFREAVLAFRDAGGRGANVTVPFKEEAYALCARVSERAQRAAAVNTLSFEAGGAVVGDNTDGAGLVRDLTQRLGLDLGGARILLLGAGGAARGVLGPLLLEGAAEIVVANRTEARARALERAFGGLGRVRACGLAAIPPGPYDLVLNATAASLAGEVPPLDEVVLAGAPLCYDLAYARDGLTPFVAWARGRGLRAEDGLGMLVEQAAEAFALWRGVRPETAPVLAALRGGAAGQ